jgi:hypothetical protein
MLQTIGALASQRWLEERGLASSTTHWYVEITMRPWNDEQGTTVLTVNIYPEEWGVIFRHNYKASSLRVTDEPFVHGRDDFTLLADLGELTGLGDLLVKLERRFGFAFDRAHATVQSNIRRATPVVRGWLVAIARP